MAPSNFSALSLGLISIAFSAPLVSAQNTNTSEYVGGYSFNVPAAVIAAVLYLAVGLYQFYQRRKFGHAYMKWLLIGQLMMGIGFILRLICKASPGSIPLYAIMTLFILLAPCLYLANSYVLLHHLASAFGPEVARGCLIIRPNWFAKVFVISDITTFLLQAAGGGLSASGGEGSLPKAITMTALVLQLVSFLTFLCCVAWFGIQMKRKYPQIWKDRTGHGGVGSWMRGETWKVFFALFFVTGLGIVIRSVFRIAEYAGGYYSYLATTEIYLYMLDTLPLFIAMSLWAIFWPTKFIDRVVADYTHLHSSNSDASQNDKASNQYGMQAV